MRALGPATPATGAPAQRHPACPPWSNARRCALRTQPDRCSRRAAQDDRRAGAFTDEVPTTPEPSAVEASSYFPTLVSRLLWNTTTKLERGKASCATCQAEGHVTCPVCGGSRVSSKKLTKAKAHAQAQLARFFGDDETHRGGDWVVTNRCSACHGAGIVDCPACHGSGLRNT